VIRITRPTPVVIVDYGRFGVGESRRFDAPLRRNLATAGARFHRPANKGLDDHHDTGVVLPEGDDVAIRAILVEDVGYGPTREVWARVGPVPQ
jgi:hypothetical protein